MKDTRVTNSKYQTPPQTLLRIPLKNWITPPVPSIMNSIKLYTYFNYKFETYINYEKKISNFFLSSVSNFSRIKTLILILSFI